MGFIISFVILTSLGKLTLANDLNPPAFAGTKGWAAAQWEFDVETPAPTAHIYNPDPTNPPEFFYDGGQWLSNEQAHELDDFLRLYMSRPEGEGDTLTFNVQVTWEGSQGFDLFIEIWQGAEHEGGSYEGGNEGIDPVITNLGNGLWHGLWYGDLGNIETADLPSILIEGADGQVIHSILIDVIVHDGGNLPVGDGTRPMTGAPNRASQPVPEDDTSDVPRNVTLSWLAGPYAATHDVYFGTDFDDVNDADPDSPLRVSSGGRDTQYAPDSLLDWDQTYYWRIDEVNSPPDATVYRGKTWRFTSEPYLYTLSLGDQVIAATASSHDPNFGPENTINGSGLNDNDEHAVYNPSDPNQADTMWLTERGATEPHWLLYSFDRAYILQEIQIWNFNRDKEDRLGYGLKELLIEYSTDGTDFIALDPVTLQQATGSAPVAPETFVLDGIVATHLRLSAVNSFKNRRFGLGEVRLLHLPLQAYGPQPASGAQDVDPDLMLSWRAGRQATSHEVYLGTDQENLAPVDTVTVSGVTVEGLHLDQTYYWQVTEINDAETPPVWEGDTWQFTTSPYRVVDDFEAYTDDNTNFEAIFQTWIDGFGYTEPIDQPGNNTGSLVGYAVSPFAEQDIVRDNSKQSMPLEYDNSLSPPISETTRSFDPPQDWTAAGIKALTLYVHGSLANQGGHLYVKVNNSQAQPVEGLDLGAEVWQEGNIDLADLAGVNLKQVTSLTIGVDQNGSSGMVYIDDIRLYPSRCIPDKVLGDLTGDCIVDADDLAVVTNNWLLTPLAVEYGFGNGLQDSSGNQRHGLGKNNPLVQNGVLSLSGSNFVDVPLGADNPFDGTRDFSITLDFKTKDPGLLLSSARNDAPDNHAMALYVDDSTDEPYWGEVIYENDGVGSATAEDDEFFFAQPWHSLAVTYNAQTTQITVYLDGQPSEGEAIYPGIPGITGDTVRIGSTRNTAAPNVGNFVGDIDNVRIFNFKLTADDIALLPRTPVIPGDLNEDGIVDQLDMDIVEANQGPIQLWP